MPDLIIIIIIIHRAHWQRMLGDHVDAPRDMSDQGGYPVSVLHGSDRVGEGGWISLLLLWGGGHGRVTGNTHTGKCHVMNKKMRKAKPCISSKKVAFDL